MTSNSVVCGRDAGVEGICCDSGGCDNDDNGSGGGGGDGGSGDGGGKFWSAAISLVM